MAPIYSHPPEGERKGIELADHLADVAERVEYVVADDATTPANEALQSVVETLARVHDFGKATTFFQEYLLEDRSPDPEALRHHAPLGSFAAYYALDVQGFDTETCLAGFVAVAKHHGRLPDVAEYVHERAHFREGVSDGDRTSAERRLAAVARQIRDIDEHAPTLAENVFETATAREGSWASFYDGFGELRGEVVDIVATSGTAPGIDRDSLSDSCYGLVLQSWSSLLLADKTSAARARNEPETYAPERPSFDRLSDHIEDIEEETSADPQGTRAERLDHFRSRARTDVLSSTRELADDGGGIATITLPTGMGKTLTGLSAAFDLRDRLGGDRVVYALPFTSIIDQVVDEVSEVYDTDTTGRLLTAHHHLAETVIRDETDAEEADRTDDIAGMLAESWRAGLTVTTFVQLFESLAGPGNRQSMKLPALRNSVVVLDEPQSLPLDWWKLVPRLVDLLTEQYGATVVAMTATQPELFEGSTELVDDPGAYFEAGERVRYDLDVSTERYMDDQSGPKTHEHAAAELGDAFEAEESALAVCNTIASARKLTECVAERNTHVDVAGVYTAELDATDNADTDPLDGVEPAAVTKRIVSKGEPALLHLSTRLRPMDRLTLVEVAKRLTDRSHPIVTVSTHLVEAGVDISFERVYRDLAPIDSIVQAAGRCNRSFERDRGRVTLWWLDAPGDQQKTPAEAVYNRGPSLLPVAAETLASVRGDGNTLSETAVARDAVTRYYQRLREGKDVGRQAYADYVDEARADELADLSLIDQRRAADVLVSRTEGERELVEQVREAASGYEFEKLRRLLDKTKPLRISVPYYREDSETAEAIGQLERLVEDEGLYYLDVRRYDSYFDETTGFVVPETSVSHQFL